jgi:uncharacterized protein (TIGR02611 family)
VADLPEPGPASMPTPASGGMAPGWRELARGALCRARARPTGRLVLRAGVALAGGLVVLVGLMLIPLPGPGGLMVLSGIGIWAVEFHWARRLQGFARRQVRRSWGWLTRRSWPLRLAAVLCAGAVAVGGLAASLQYAAGVDVYAMGAGLIADLCGYLDPA